MAEDKEWEEPVAIFCNGMLLSPYQYGWVRESDGSMEVSFTFALKKSSWSIDVGIPFLGSIKKEGGSGDEISYQYRDGRYVYLMAARDSEPGEFATLKELVPDSEEWENAQKSEIKIHTWP